MTNRKRTMNDNSWSSFAPTRSIKKDIEFKRLYNKRHTQEKFKYLPSAVYLALICIAMYIFVCPAEISFHNERGITGR